MKPTVADSRTPKRLILRGPADDLPAVTAEAAGSSPVVPAIYRFSDIGKHFGWFDVVLVSNRLRVAESSRGGFKIGLRTNCGSVES
jgi:hypothetical protein